MDRRLFLRGFTNKDEGAVFVVFYCGLRVVTGTVGTFIGEILDNKMTLPFVLEADSGCLAAGGVTSESPEFVKGYIRYNIISCARRNHNKGLQNSIVPIVAGSIPQSLMTICPIPPVTEVKNEPEDYEQLETFVDDWMRGYPGMFV